MPPHGIGLSVKMTVDNNAGDPDIPGYPALLSTGFSGAGIIFHRHCPVPAAVDNWYYQES